MTSSQENKGWLAMLIEGGIPQIVAGPAGKAISRLVGAGVEIPAAWLEQKAQAIRDETKAKSQLMETLAEKSAELGFSDPQLLERGLNNMLGKAYRAQENREKVAKKTVEYLSEDIASVQSEGPSDEWMNIFEEYASKANSERLQQTWGRILAGEIRKPGATSLATLQLMSILDQETALAVETALGYVFAEDYASFDDPTGKLLNQLLLAKSVGVIGSLDDDYRVTLAIPTSGFATLVFQEGICIMIYGVVNSEVELHCTSVTRVGRELLSIIRPKFNMRAVNSLVNKIKSHENVFKISISDPFGKTENIYGPRIIWENTSINQT
ncbi:DUF2806 domain-containing protein [Ochrobactrum sp. MR34]|nr:DUF2806 domain-containing protein [Ochrobactrum sp. MR34]